MRFPRIRFFLNGRVSILLVSEGLWQILRFFQLVLLLLSHSLLPRGLILMRWRLALAGLLICLQLFLSYQRRIRFSGHNNLLDQIRL